MIIGCILTIVASFFFLVSTRTSQRSGEIVLGLASIMILSSLMKYFENIKAYNIILNTMINSIVITIKALVGSFPFFMAFAVFGNTVFIESERFRSIPMSLYTLFSFANGDLIFASFYELKEISFLVSQLYIYIYLFMSV